jgi:chromosomal replication initiator protein
MIYPDIRPNPLLAELRNSVGHEAWNSWFSDLSVTEQETGIELQSENQFVVDWITNHYGYELRKLGITIVKSRSHRSTTTTPQPPRTTQSNTQRSKLNPEMRFSNFVVSPTNHFAFEAAQGLEYNPHTTQQYHSLFINGEAGVGKTHLLNAIGWRMQEHGLRTIYLSSDQFLRQFVDAVRAQNANAFADALTAADCLLIDDFQFLIGKERTQECFFNVFNQIMDAKKIMVVTSDEPSIAFSDLNPRMQSRLGSCMPVTIEPPDYELKFGLLKHWQPTLSPEVLHLLANLKISVRELKGALTRVMVQASCYNADITPEFVKNALHSLFNAGGLAPTMNDILEAVVAYSCKNIAPITKDELRNNGRRGVVAKMRQVCMYLAHELVDTNAASMGRFFSNRNRTTISRGIQHIKTQLATDLQLSNAVSEIRSKLGC